MARTLIVVPRLPTGATIAMTVLAIALGALSIFAAAPRFDSFARGAFLGAGCTLLVGAGLLLAPLVWERAIPATETPDWRPSGTRP